MNSLIAICSMVLFVNTSIAGNTIKDPETLKIKCTEQNTEVCSLVNEFTFDLAKKPARIEDIYVYEVDEDLSFGFDINQYLPKDFNSLKGLYDLNWDTIELIDIEEEVIIDFDTKQYLPENFCPNTDM